MKKILACISILCCLIFLGYSQMNIPQQQARYDFAPLIPDYAKKLLGEIPQPLNNIATIDGVYLGKKLFYDKKLSADNTMSCATCHAPGKAFADFRQFSIGLQGQIGLRNAPALFNMAWGNHFFWNGRAATLEHQINDPIVNPIEMANSWDTVIARLSTSKEYEILFAKAFGNTIIDSMTVTKALAQFERSLLSFNSRYDRYYYQQKDTLTASELKGLKIFSGKGKCNTCHAGVLLTDNNFRNNGLDKRPAEGRYEFTKLAADYGKWKVPSLRNIALTAPYMHDGRFERLEDVVAFYSDQIQHKSKNIDSLMRPLGKGIRLSMQEQKDLVAFLKTLTDYEFASNKLHVE